MKLKANRFNNELVFFKLMQLFIFSVESSHPCNNDFERIGNTLRVVVILIVRVLTVVNRLEKKEKECIFCSRKGVKMIWFTCVIVMWVARSSLCK